MAKNILGEVETQPGAGRRELAVHKWHAAGLHARTARTILSRIQPVRARYKNMSHALNETRDPFYEDMIVPQLRKDEASLRSAFKRASKHRKAAYVNRLSAAVDYVIAGVQTLKAQLA